jgi:hypothetical protein
MLNRLRNLKPGKIGLKSGKIVKIGWNRLKSRFHCRFNDFARRKLNTIQEPRVDRLLDIPNQMQFIILSSPNQSVFSLLFTVHIHCSRIKTSSSEIPKLKTQNSKSSLRIPQWLGVSDSRSRNLFLSANNQPPSTSTTALASRPWSSPVFSSLHRENQSPHNNNGVSPVFTR